MRSPLARASVTECPTGWERIKTVRESVTAVWPIQSRRPHDVTKANRADSAISDQHGDVLMEWNGLSLRPYKVLSGLGYP